MATNHSGLVLRLQSLPDRYKQHCWKRKGSSRDGAALLKRKNHLNHARRA